MIIVLLISNNHNTKQQQFISLKTYAENVTVCLKFTVVFSMGTLWVINENIYEIKTYKTNKKKTI